MLALVVADRYEVGLVQEDVARHEDGVREEPGRDEVVPVGLLLELCHAAQLAVARDGGQQPRRLRVRLHMALAEHRRPLGVEAGREQHRREVERRLAQNGGLVLDGDRVEVDDAEERVVRLLRLRVLAEAAAVVAQRLAAGGLDSGKDCWLVGHEG